MMLAQGADWARVVAQSFRPLDQDLVREKAKQEQARRLAKFTRQRERLLRRSILFGVGSVALFGTEAASWLHPPGALWPAVTGGLCAFVAIGSYRKRHMLEEPQPIPLPPPSLPPDAIGAAEAARLAHVRGQLVAMVDAVSQLHPDAGAELKRADDEAGKAFGPLVERLQVLDRIRRQMPGGPAAISATESAIGIANRLSIGVDSYERLLASAATMLGSPDISAHGITDELQHAAQALTAYSHGLGVAAPDEDDHTQL